MRKSAAEYIRQLEMRVARLERTAGEDDLYMARGRVIGELANLSPDSALQKEIVSRLGNDLKVLEAKKALSKAWSAFLKRHGKLTKGLKEPTSFSEYKAMISKAVGSKDLPTRLTDNLKAITDEVESPTYRDIETKGKPSLNYK